MSEDNKVQKQIDLCKSCVPLSTEGISGITTKAPCEAALIGVRHVRIEIADFVMCTFVRRSDRKKTGKHDAEEIETRKAKAMCLCFACFLLPKR